jgi:hypothetical protein
MLIKLGNRIRLTKRVADELELITGVRPEVRTVEELATYLHAQVERFSPRREETRRVREEIYEYAGILLTFPPIKDVGFADS